MKPVTILSIAAIVLFAACQKTKETVVLPEYRPQNDFLYLPVKDAVWQIHLQGAVIGDVISDCQEKIKGDYDTGYHEYYTLEALGTDTVLEGKKYFQYKTTGKYWNTGCPYGRIKEGTGLYFLREDTAAKKVIAWGGGNWEDVVADFADEQPGNIARTSPFWPNAHIAGHNNLVIGNETATMWEMTLDYKPGIKYFYKAHGIGNQTGFLPEWVMRNCQPVSIDFTYKGKTNHFDFPFFPNHNLNGNPWW